MTSPSLPVVPLVLRGEIIEDSLIEIPGRGGSITFQTPDAHQYLDKIPLGNPAKMADLYALSFDDILDFLEALGDRLDINKNEYLQQARDLSYAASPLTPSIIDAFYATIGLQFNRQFLKDMADTDIGIDRLDGWVEEQVYSGPRTRVRCFGARALHIAAGNGPSGTTLALIRNALTRSDAIIKSPSNDPFTGPAILRTMCELDASHPLTKHISVAYWRGGDEAFESRLYQPHNIEKILAWGGYTSVKHVTQYIQPGLELIAMDPKRSASVLGEEAVASDATMKEAAIRLAADFAGLNQNGCVNSRVAYVLSGSDDEGLEKANQLAQMTYDAMLELPEHLSGKPKHYNPELRSRVNALRLEDDFYHVIGGKEDEGAVIVSQFPDAVDFVTELIDRTLNIVPVDTLDEAIEGMDAYTQTVGVYPEALKAELVDKLPLYGVQRFVSLGYACAPTMAGPHDAMEPLARMVKWVVDEVSSPEERPAPWQQ